MIRWGQEPTRRGWSYWDGIVDGGALTLAASLLAYALTHWS